MKKVQFVENKGDNSSAEEDTPFFVESVTLVDKDAVGEDEDHHKTSSSEKEEPPVYVDCMDDQDAMEDEWIANVDVNGTEVSLKLDTGSQVNILPMKDFYRLKRKPKVYDKKVNLRMYDDKPISTKGVCRVSLSCNGKNVNAFFVLVDGLRQPLLGLKACIALGLIKRVHVINKENVTQKGKAKATDWVKEYSDVLKGIGRLPGEHKIKLRADAEPVIHPARKVPIALKKRLREKLDTLIEENIVRKIEEPTEWVNSLVILEK